LKVTSIIQEDCAASVCSIEEVSYTEEIVTSYRGLEGLGWGCEQPRWSQGFLKGLFCTGRKYIRGGITSFSSLKRLISLQGVASQKTTITFIFIAVTISEVI
jgi:hypothetical protein